MKAKIIRTERDVVQTLGELLVLDDNDLEVYRCKTLELTWKENRQNESCIPPGVYRVKKRWSRRFHWHFHIQDVEDRTWILIHQGNFYTDIKGCILVGREHKDINEDDFRDVTYSARTIRELLRLLPDEFTLTIEEKIT